MTAKKSEQMTASELENAKPVADCAFCNSTLVSASNSTAEFADKSLYCPVCSETLAIAAADGDTPDMTSDKDAAKTDDTSDLGDDTEEDDTDLPEGEDESDDDDDSNSDADADDEEDADDESEDDEENDETDTDDTAEDNTDDAGDNSDSKDDPSDESEKDTSDGDDSDSDDDASAAKTDKPVTAVAGKGGELEASLLEAMAGKENDINIVQSPDRSRWFLFANNSPIAISEAARCQENLRGAFSTNQFATAFVAATEEGVTQDILDEFGFEPVMTKVSVDEAVRQNVEAQVQEKAAQHTMMASAYGERFQQCFGMAAAALPKRFFKGDKNPVEKALVTSLRKVGVRDAESIVANAFENHGKNLYKTIVLRAQELMDKDDKTINEIAKLIDDKEAPETDNSTESKPIAALASMEEEPVLTPKIMLASDSEDDDVFGTFFQRNRR